MTPKEKAEELILRFMNLQEPNYNWFHKILGKKCALIAVDEIIKTFDCTTPQSIDYWQEVKEKINKL